MKKFLREYVDVLFYQQTKDRRKRKRLYDSHFATGETTTPLNAPRWTKSGYNGSILKAITIAIKNCKNTGNEHDECS